MHRTRVRGILVLPAEISGEKNTSKHFIQILKEVFVPQDSQTKTDSSPLVNSQDEPGKKSFHTVAEPGAEMTWRQTETQEWARPAAHNVSQEYSTQEGADRTEYFIINCTFQILVARGIHC